MTTDIYDSPDSETAADIIENAIESRAIIQVDAECEVDYDGRAQSYLGPGDRLIVCKPDGAVLVHKPSGHDPVNWQTPGSTLFTDIDEETDELILTARQTDPAETISVYLNTIYSITCYHADDTATLTLEGTEKDMHRHIMDNPEEIEAGIRPIEHERDTPVGQIDVYANDTDGTPVLIEVKRRQASLKHVDQLRRYMDRYRNHPDTDTEANVRGMLVAPAASDKVKQTLADNDLEFVALNPSETDTSNPNNAALTDF